MHASDVGGQVAPVGVGHIRAAHFASERFFTQVDIHMLLEVSFLQEALDGLTDVTLEWLVFTLGVCTLDVPLHLPLGDHEAALVATDFLVRSVVVVERGDVGKGLGALVTLVNFLTVVGFVMESHV